MTHYHPRTNDKGQPVKLHTPNHPTELRNWAQSDQISTVTPDSPMPEAVNGLSFASWQEAPAHLAGWAQLAEVAIFDEPELKKVTGKVPASGAVVVETDGRVWVVSPSNKYGGYKNTFPKGKLDPMDGLSLKANALKEVFEEAGLRVGLSGYLCDSERDTTVTRFYLARRLGGSPADMGWESQAVHLVPMDILATFASHPNDQSVINALQTNGAV
jgi:ADP-ribose pyrophosphatase YjhB (NUDIX family)